VTTSLVTIINQFRAATKAETVRTDLLVHHEVVKESVAAVQTHVSQVHEAVTAGLEIGKDTHAMVNGRTSTLEARIDLLEAKLLTALRANANLQGQMGQSVTQPKP
jgi:hypothetical protein